MPTPVWELLVIVNDLNKDAWVRTRFFQDCWNQTLSLRMFYGTGNLTMPAPDTSLLPDKDGFHAYYLMYLPFFCSEFRNARLKR